MEAFEDNCGLNAVPLRSAENVTCQCSGGYMPNDGSCLGLPIGLSLDHLPHIVLASPKN